MPTNLDAATLRAVEAEMSRLMQPEDGTGRYLDAAETWNSLLAFVRAAAPRPVAEPGEDEDRNRDCHICPTCTCYGPTSPPPPAEAREEQ